MTRRCILLLMKLLACVFFILIPVAGMCISVDDLGRLAELGTADDLVFQIIEKEGMNRSINAKDVIYLKERGLSDRVIDYLWKQSFQDKEFLPPQEGESKMIDESLRTYEGIDRAGNKIVVLTNLDEEGRRMGPPPPPKPDPEPQPQVIYTQQPPQQIYVEARPQGPAWASQEQDAQRYQPSSIGITDYYGYYPFYSTISFIPARHFVPHRKPTWPHHKKVNIHAPVKWPGLSAKRWKK